MNTVIDVTASENVKDASNRDPRQVKAYKTSNQLIVKVFVWTSPLHSSTNPLVEGLNIRPEMMHCEVSPLPVASMSSKRNA